MSGEEFDDLPRVTGGLFWHQINQKRKAKGLAPFSEADYDGVCDTLDLLLDYWVDAKGYDACHGDAVVQWPYGEVRGLDLFEVTSKNPNAPFLICAAQNWEHAAELTWSLRPEHTVASGRRIGTSSITTAGFLT